MDALTIKRFARYGELGLAPEIVNRLAVAEATNTGNFITPLMAAYCRAFWGC